MSAPSKLLIDTDVLIDFLRGRSKAQQILEAAVASHVSAISVITLAEIFAGMRSSEEKDTEAFLKGFDLIPVTEDVARLAGRLRNRHRRVLLPDCLIAATAISDGAALLTFNRKDYPFEGLRFYTGE